MSSPEIAKFVQMRMKAIADPKKVPAMAAYMKTDMPFYGIAKPERAPIYKELKKKFVPESRKEYESNVLALWRLKHREEKYAAIDYASRFKEFIVPDSVSLYESMIREGAWWDFVDPIAIWLVGDVLRKSRIHLRKELDKWIQDDDMWIRRTALIAHNSHKKETDGKQLFRHCLLRASEEEFFIRKAIGWALREYSYAEPVAVKDFLLANKHKLSSLSFREGAKGLVRTGIMR